MVQSLFLNKSRPNEDFQSKVKKTIHDGKVYINALFVYVQKSRVQVINNITYEPPNTVIKQISVPELIIW